MDLVRFGYGHEHLVDEARSLQSSIGFGLLNIVGVGDVGVEILKMKPRDSDRAR